MEEEEREERHEGTQEERQEAPSPAGAPPGQMPGGVLPGRVINPYLLGAGFLAYCEKHEWVVAKGEGLKKKYYLTAQGEVGLKGFGIEL